MAGNRRRQLDRLAIDERQLRKQMRALFPKANDYGPFAGAELIDELRHFGLSNRKQVRLLLKRHRRQLLHIDRSVPSLQEQRTYAAAFGEEFSRSFRRTRVWFAYPALLRLALELEFGARYEAFAARRDGI